MCSSDLGDFNSGQNEKTIHWQAILAHQFFPQQIIDRFASIVISNGEAVQSFCPRAGNQIFRTGNAVAGKKVWVWRSILNGIARQR